MHFTVWEHSPDQIGIWKCWFLNKDENQQQTQPTYNTGNRTRATFVGGESSHYCAIPATRYVIVLTLFSQNHESEYVYTKKCFYHIVINGVKIPSKWGVPSLSYNFNVLCNHLFFKATE